jgi:hypothetical protein
VEPLLRASLATLAVLSLLGGVAAVLRREPREGAGPERKLERVGLLLHHGVALGVAVAAALGALLGGGDGRPLALCAAGPLLVLCLQEAVPARLALLSVPLVVIGLLAQGLVLVGLAPPELVGPACAGLAGGACAAGALACALKRKTAAAPRARALLASQGFALGVASAGCLAGLFPLDGLWAVALGTAGTLGTAGRLQPAAPPGARELLGATLVVVVALAAGAAAPLPLVDAALVGIWAGLVATAAFALVRATVDPARSAHATAKEKEKTPQGDLPPAAALAAMAPLLDDPLLRRPPRPRVIARVPARRLLDAALERARQAQPAARSRRDELLRVDVHATDNDIDVDGDPADLAEALCAVLDNALRVRAHVPEARVQVHLRGSAASVTFEVSDALPQGTAPVDAGIPDADAPFLHPRDDDDRPGLGVSLARARLLVERNGGQLLTRSSGEGSTVQVTMPRRMHKGAVGQA